MAFAKLFDTELGQVLCKIDTNEEACPEVRFFCEPEGFGVCSYAISFSDSDQGWDEAESLFEKVDLETARNAAQEVFSKFQKLLDK